MFQVVVDAQGEVVKQLKLYYSICEVAKAAMAEYNHQYAETLTCEYAFSGPYGGMGVE